MGEDFPVEDQAPVNPDEQQALQAQKIEVTSPGYGDTVQLPTKPDVVTTPTDQGDTMAHDVPHDIDHDKSKLVEDPEKAWDMAHASNEERSAAAMFRAGVKDESMNPRSVDRLLSMAEDADKNAEELESWAAIIHDHPVSETYRKSHENVDFNNPHFLKTIEANAKNATYEAEALQHQLENAPLTVGVKGLSTLKGKFRPSDSLAEACGMSGFQGDAVIAGKEFPSFVSQENAERFNQYVELISNPDTTLGQLKDVFTQAFTEIAINPELAYADSINTVLEDIRSGRAAA